MIEYRTMACRECGYFVMENSKYLNRKELETKRCPKCGSKTVEVSSRTV